jgi:hypothetical protein
MGTTQSLAVRSFSTSELGVKAILDETSLLVPDGTPFEVVERMLTTMKGLRNCTLWWIGDLLLHAERSFGEKYAQLLDSTDFEYSTLRNVSYVVTNVAPAVRRKELTFWHHLEVAPLPPADQKKFLKIAVEQRLSASALRAMIKNKSKEPGPNKAETFELALRSILKIARNSPDFSKDEFVDRAGKISDVVIIAITAADALRAFEK